MAKQKVGRSGKKGISAASFISKSPSHLEWKKIGTVETTGSLSFFSDLRAQIFS